MCTLAALVGNSAERMAERRRLPLLRSLDDASSMSFDPEARALTLRLGGHVDMQTIGHAARDAQIARLRVEANDAAWSVVESPRWRAPLRNVELELVRV